MYTKRARLPCVLANALNQRLEQPQEPRYDADRICLVYFVQYVCRYKNTQKI